MPEIDKSAEDLFATTAEQAPRLAEEDALSEAQRKADDTKGRIDKLEKVALPKKPNPPGIGGMF